MRGRLEPKDTVERFWGLKFIPLALRSVDVQYKFGSKFY